MALLSLSLLLSLLHYLLFLLTLTMKNLRTQGTVHMVHCQYGFGVKVNELLLYFQKVNDLYFASRRLKQHTTPYDLFTLYMHLRSQYVRMAVSGRGGTISSMRR